MKTFFIYTDGGASGNPGEAGIGVVIKEKVGDSFKTLTRISEPIGITTNNQAEYQALIRAMEELLQKYQQNDAEYHFFLDSELIVSQLKLKYKVKNSELQPLFLKVHNLAVQLGSVFFSYIPREKNQEADKLVKEAINKSKSKQ